MKRPTLPAGLVFPSALVSVVSIGLAVGAGALAMPACTSPDGDAAADAGTPSALGSGLRIRDVMNPSAKGHPDVDAGVEVDVSVTGASVLWVDTYDETNNGKSIGTVYVQDVASTKPYSGSELYAPDYFPASLAPAPGDVLDISGGYEELSHIGSAMFTPPATLPQFDHPNATFRYEYTPPTPVVIQASDLADYDSGRRYYNMLVTIENVQLTEAFYDSSGRITAPFTADMQNGPSISNENVAIDPTQYAADQTFTSITGIVTWFFSYHVAPRTLDDLKTQ